MTRSGIVAFQGFSTTSEHDFEKLSRLKNEEWNKLEDDEEFIVSRENIFQDMINIYRNRSITKLKIHILFYDETASGNGVTRDAISLFYNTLYSMFEGANEKVPLPNIETEELEIVGKLITHAFLIHGIFPVQICKSSLLNVLYGESDREILLVSFLIFFPGKEAVIIRKLACGESVKHICSIQFK